MVSKKCPEKKILEIFASVLQEEHQKISKSKKAKRSTKKKQKVLYIDSDASDSDESTELIYSTTNENHRMDFEVVETLKRTKNRRTVKQLKI
jgi:hypothetical protein